MTEQNDIFVGDNDHGDSKPTPITDPNGWVTGNYGDAPEPKCASCGVPWVDHMGIMGVCLNNKALREDLKDSLEAHDEMMLLIEQLYTERDEARREVCVLLHTDENGCVRVGKPSEAAVRGWDCFETPKEKDPVEVQQKWKAYRLRKEEQQKAMDRLSKLDEELGLTSLQSDGRITA